MPVADLRTWCRWLETADRRVARTTVTPDVEVITAENAPWWANRIGRVQRMDAARVVAFAEAVMDTSRKQAERPSVHPKAPTRRAAGG